MQLTLFLIRSSELLILYNIFFVFYFGIFFFSSLFVFGLVFVINLSHMLLHSSHILYSQCCENQPRRRRPKNCLIGEKSVPEINRPKRRLIGLGADLLIYFYYYCNILLVSGYYCCLT